MDLDGKWLWLWLCAGHAYREGNVEIEADDEFKEQPRDLPYGPASIQSRCVPRLRSDGRSEDSRSDEDAGAGFFAGAVKVAGGASSHSFEPAMTSAHAAPCVWNATPEYSPPMPRVGKGSSSGRMTGGTSDEWEPSDGVRDELAEYSRCSWSHSFV